MKLVTLSGGLGNQMFQYAFYLSLKVCDKKVYLYKNKIANSHDHNGYELERLFHVENNYRGGWLTNLLSVKLLGNILKHILFPIKIRERVLYDFSIYGRWLNRNPFYGVHLVGYWQSECYFEQIENSIRNVFAFDEKMLNEQTKNCLKELCKNNAVSLHVRRGDYLLSYNAGTFCNISDTQYYSKAIELLLSKTVDPAFYVFSDDIEWVINNLTLPENTIFVDWNKGKDSWQDMFLMSVCKHNIIANSSFSWWGAWLNKNKNKIVIAPMQWMRLIPAPDLVPTTWIRI